MKAAVALIALLLSAPAFAGDKWVYEFEFDIGIPGHFDRLLDEAKCYSKVIPAEHAKKYLDLGKPIGLEMSCGNKQPIFQHFLGRECWRPLPKLLFECGWRHFSSPFDKNEISFDALAIRGRFSF